MHKIITLTLLLISCFCAHRSTECAAHTSIQRLKKFTLINITDQPQTFLYQGATQNKCEMICVPAKSTEIIFAIPHVTEAVYMHKIDSPELRIPIKTVTILPDTHTLVIKDKGYE
jgi:hypothetical protein